MVCGMVLLGLWKKVPRKEAKGQGHASVKNRRMRGMSKVIPPRVDAGVDVFVCRVYHPAEEDIKLCFHSIDAILGT